MQRMGVDAVGGDAAAEGRGSVKAAAASGARRRRRLQCAARGEFWVIANPCSLHMTFNRLQLVVRAYNAQPEVCLKEWLDGD